LPHYETKDFDKYSNVYVMQNQKWKRKDKKKLEHGVYAGVVVKGLILRNIHTVWCSCDDLIDHLCLQITQKFPKWKTQNSYNHWWLVKQTDPSEEINKWTRQMTTSRLLLIYNYKTGPANIWKSIAPL